MKNNYGMSESKIRTYKLEKHQTKDILDKHVNGFLIPVWRDWDEIYFNQT